MSLLGWIFVGVAFFAFIWWRLLKDTDTDQDKDFDSKVPPLTFPPFGTLRWSKYDYWEGTGCLPAWAGFGSTSGDYVAGTLDQLPISDGSFALIVFPHNPRHNRAISDEQQKAFQFQIDHAANITETILNAMPKHYIRQREDWMLEPSDMPDITEPEKFRKMIALSSMTIHPFFKDGMAYVGLVFGCEWDSEHSLGVMLHGSRIIGIGDHDAASADQRPDEAQDPKN